MASSALSLDSNYPHAQTITLVSLRRGMSLKRLAPCLRLESFAHTFIKQLKRALDKYAPGKWELNPGDGAFYGPKIDITIMDALKRSFQCATIQLDFQLPDRFNLKYRDANDNEQTPDKAPSKPVMIHRAILGSLERFIAIITEHFGGKWYVISNYSLESNAEFLQRPFWLNPRQVLVVPVSTPYVCSSVVCLEIQLIRP